MAESVLKALKQRYNGRSFLHQSNGDAAVQSLDIMRLNIQEAFDKEIDGIVRKYIDVSTGIMNKICTRISWAVLNLHRDLKYILCEFCPAPV